MLTVALMSFSLQILKIADLISPLLLLIECVTPSNDQMAENSREANVSDRPIVLEYMCGGMA